MKLNEKTKELLQRYLLGVKKELGGKEQEDITAEIESYIYDLLEERFADEKDISVKQLESVLDEMGAPRKVAAQYSPQRYLIGPRLFPIYWLVLKILAAVVVGGISLSLIIAAVVGNPSTPTVNALEFIGSLWSGLLSAAGAVTIVFAVIGAGHSRKNDRRNRRIERIQNQRAAELPEDEKKFSPIGISLKSHWVFWGYCSSPTSRTQRAGSILSKSRFQWGRWCSSLLTTLCLLYGHSGFDRVGYCPQYYPAGAITAQRVDQLVEYRFTSGKCGPEHLHDLRATAGDIGFLP